MRFSLRRMKCLMDAREWRAYDVAAGTRMAAFHVRRPTGWTVDIADTRLMNHREAEHELAKLENESGGP